MAAIRNILYSMLLGMMIVSCSTSDDMSDEQGMEQPTAKQVDLLMSIGDRAMKLVRSLPTPIEPLRSKAWNCWWLFLSVPTTRQ